MLNQCESRNPKQQAVNHMGWKASGDERAKSFQVYKNLEASYLDLQQRYNDLEARLHAKDDALRQLSRELYQALDGPTRETTKHLPVPEAIPASQEQKTPIPQHRPSAVVSRHTSPADIIGSAEEVQPKRKEG